MKKGILLWGVLWVLGVGAVQASDLEYEVMPMAYVQVPFGAESRKEKTPTFGFGIARGERDRSTGVVSFLNTRSAPYVDFKYQGDEIKAIEFHGINALNKRVVFNADGTATTATGINWSIVVPAVVLGAVVINEANDDDDSSSATSQPK